MGAAHPSESIPMRMRIRCCCCAVECAHSSKAHHHHLLLWWKADDTKRRHDYYEPRDAGLHSLRSLMALPGAAPLAAILWRACAQVKVLFIHAIANLETQILPFLSPDKDLASDDTLRGRNPWSEDTDA